MTAKPAFTRIQTPAASDIVWPWQRNASPGESALGRWWRLPLLLMLCATLTHANPTGAGAGELNDQAAAHSTAPGTAGMAVARPIRLHIAAADASDAPTAARLDAFVRGARDGALAGLDVVADPSDADWRLVLVRPMPFSQATEDSLPAPAPCQASNPQCPGLQLWVVSRQGRLVDASLLVTWDDHRAPLPVLARLSRYARAQAMRGLGWQSRATPVRMAVSLRRSPPQNYESCNLGRNNTAWVQHSIAAPGDGAARTQDCLTVGLHNTDTQESWYAYVLAVGPDHSVRQLWPPPEAPAEAARMAPEQRRDDMPVGYRLHDPGPQAILLLTTGEPIDTSDLFSGSRTGTASTTLWHARVTPHQGLILQRRWPDRASLTGQTNAAISRWGLSVTAFDVHGEPSDQLPLFRGMIQDCHNGALQEFPWPNAPQPSSAELLPRRLLNARADPQDTLASVAKRLDQAVTAAGYPSVRYFNIDCKGFAMVLPFERIDAEGRRPSGTWGFATPDQTEPFDLVTYVHRLFFAPPGLYRQIVLAVSTTPMSQSTQPPTDVALRALVRTGRSRLPHAFEQILFTSGHEVNVLVYEFTKAVQTGEVAVVPPQGKLPPYAHLKQAGLY